MMDKDEIERQIVLLKKWIKAVNWNGDGDPGLLTDLGIAKDEMMAELNNLNTKLSSLS